MRKIILIACCLLMGHTAFSQANAINPFQLKLGLGAAYSHGSLYTSPEYGAIFSIEPQFALSDALSLGLRLDITILANESSDYNTNGQIGQGEVSDLVTGKYYFTDNLFRPYLGFGAGIVRIVAVGDDGSVISETINLNAMVSVGFDISHFWMDLEYNLVPGRFPLSQNSYTALKLGVYFGGGRVK